MAGREFVYRELASGIMRSGVLFHDQELLLLGFIIGLAFYHFFLLNQARLGVSVSRLFRWWSSTSFALLLDTAVRLAFLRVVPTIDLQSHSS